MTLSIYMTRSYNCGYLYIVYKSGIEYSRAIKLTPDMHVLYDQTKYGSIVPKEPYQKVISNLTRGDVLYGTRVMDKKIQALSHQLSAIAKENGFSLVKTRFSLYGSVNFLLDKDFLSNRDIDFPSRLFFLICCLLVYDFDFIKKRFL